MLTCRNPPPLPPFSFSPSMPKIANGIGGPLRTLPGSQGTWTCPRRHTPCAGPGRSRTGPPPSRPQAVVTAWPRGWRYLSRDPPEFHAGIRGRWWRLWAGDLKSPPLPSTSHPLVWFPGSFFSLRDQNHRLPHICYDWVIPPICQCVVFSFF